MYYSVLERQHMKECEGMVIIYLLFPTTFLVRGYIPHLFQDCLLNDARFLLRIMQNHTKPDKFGRYSYQNISPFEILSYCTNFDVSVHVQQDKVSIGKTRLKMRIVYS